MKYHEKMKKVIENIEHLNWELIEVLNENDGIQYLAIKKQNGFQETYPLDLLANFCWCPYCNEALGDSPVCTKCGEVSGAPERFYEYGVIRKHYKFQVIDTKFGENVEKDKIYYTEDEIRQLIKRWFRNPPNWDGTIHGLNELKYWFTFKEIDIWEE